MLKFIKIIIWIWVIFWIIFYVNYSKVADFTIKENKTIQIKSWDNISTWISRELWISEFYFKVFINLNPKNKIEVQAWEYRLLAWENLESIIKTISYWSMSVDQKITILEWRNIYDIDKYLSKLEIINPWEFISEAKNISKYQKDYSFLEKAKTLEWFLYPDTYFVKKNWFQQEVFINKMLENFRKKVYDNLLSTLTKDQVVEVINFASIVEKEAFPKWWYEEKAIVSWILKKRFVENWMIWADITACYAYNLTWEECKMQLSKYIAEKNDYNTRTMVWLPKTPIWNPSFDSINSVINSKSTPYYYYLHDNKWNIYYARTNEEHVANKNKYLR